MTTYPVHYDIERPEQFSRVQLLIRAFAFLVLGLIGVSFGSFFVFAYLALPVYAAIRLSSSGGADAYADRDGPRVTAALHWFATVCAWASLTVDRLPQKEPVETVELSIEEYRAANVSSAIWRVVTGLPSAFVLMVLCFVGVFVWLWAALTILFSERVGAGAFNYLVGLQRWSVRLLAYQASLVERYPPFSFSDYHRPRPEVDSAAA